MGRVVWLFVGFYVCRLYLRERETGDGSHTLAAEPADGIGGSPRHFCAVSPFVFFTSGTLVEGLWKYTFPLALFGAVVPTVCFTMGAPRLKSGVATILSSIELPVAVVMAYLVLKETVHFWRWFGVLLILFAIAYGELREKKAGSTEPQSK